MWSERSVGGLCSSRVHCKLENGYSKNTPKTARQRMAPGALIRSCRDWQPIAAPHSATSASTVATAPSHELVRMLLDKIPGRHPACSCKCVCVCVCMQTSEQGSGAPPAGSMSLPDILSRPLSAGRVTAERHAHSKGNDFSHKSQGVLNVRSLHKICAIHT